MLVQVSRNQEVIKTIAREASRRGITAASISLIGAVQRATVSVMKKDQPKTDYLREYDQPFELTGTGEITNDGVHVHVTLAGEDLIVAGHLHAGRSRISSSGRTSRRSPIDAPTDQHPSARSAATGVAACSRRSPCHDYNGHCAGSRERLR
ncbi:PPC domain-containing DNA-binding protein [Actinoplanes nipponensis]|uniref:PPC domain-containing DNA-binding protein n=1 Tax=Actinoplanes nipponensis TaxID=135950 RepID=UPI001EF2C391|nr:PPC domain-containing DNA-binding protein [Actinoplanes nipponensis]